MDTEAPMHGRTIYAQEDPVRDRRPSRVLRIAIETHLIVRLRFQFPEHEVLVRERIGRHGRGVRERKLDTETQEVHESTDRTPPERRGEALGEYM